MNQLPESLDGLFSVGNSLLPSLSLETIVWGAFYILVSVFAIHSLILLYHWIRYGSVYALTWIMMMVHVGVSLALISTMLGAALILT